ncbi:MAG: glycosyltransferase family 9 protein [Pseudobdellovibrio sp.]
MSLKKVLLIRLDKIGDLICTLPADQVLDEKVYDVTWVVQEGLGSIVDLGTKHRNYIELDKKNIKQAREKLNSLLKELKPDIAISFQCPWWVNFELFKAQVPVRSGVKSQWHSFLFLNKAIRQKRSLAEKHELEYNLDLLYKTLNIKQTKEFHYFHINKPDSTAALTAHNLTSEKYVVVHPGMMGSALNWPQQEYIKYIQRLISEGNQVVVTGTDQDEPYLTEIKKEFLANKNVTWLQSKLSLKELIQILAYSKFVVAPSTGVAHLTASVGTLVKGIYSPKTVHHPKRWGPRGPKVEVFMLDEHSCCSLK